MPHVLSHVLSLSGHIIAVRLIGAPWSMNYAKISTQRMSG